MGGTKGPVSANQSAARVNKTRLADDHGPEQSTSEASKLLAFICFFVVVVVVGGAPRPHGKGFCRGLGSKFVSVTEGNEKFYRRFGSFSG